MTTPDQTEDRNAAAREQARAQLASICAMVAALECDYDRLEELKDELETLTDAVSDADEALDGTLENADALLAAREALTDWQEENQEELDELTAAAGDCEDADEARQRIEEDALSIQVRGDWHSPGESDGSQPTEFEILLCTGGPACKIWGELNQYNEPDRAVIYFQDWFTSWEELILTSEEHDAVLTYCQVFYFGE